MPNDLEYQKRYYQENREKVLKRMQNYHIRYYSDKPEKLLLRSAKSRAKSRGLEFNLTIDDIIIPDRCPVLKVPMIRGTFYAPSLDRIENDKGYIKGNVRVMSKLANSMKNKATKEELERFAHWVLNN